ncbi:MAG: GNAT family N-acetyltransferase [Bacteroidota bacterium]
MLNQSHKELLLSEKDHNIALIYLAQEYPLLEVIESDMMLMCRFMSEEEWCHFSHNSSPGFIDKFLSTHNKGQYIAISDDIVFNHIRQLHRVVWSISCYRLFLNSVIPPGGKGILVPLKQEQLKLVYDNSGYQQFLSMDYLKIRLQLGGGYCVLSENKTVGWIMTHDDGSVGMLHILEPYRRMGFAGKLIEAMSYQVMLEGREVYAHIEPSNTPSLKLFQSLGFEIRGKITWAFFK